MIDEAMAERLSRYLDGDLTDSESAELEALLQSDAELAAELDGLRRLQLAVRLAADRMEPPDALDTLIEPLRTGQPHAPRRLNPAIRWMGVAAGVALAVTVALEVARRSPAPSTSPRPPAPSPAAAPDESEIFQLQPLPTSPIPQDEELIGASDRLLASPVNEPQADEPEALDVRGPLPVPKDTNPTPGRLQESERPSTVGADRLDGKGRTRGAVAAAPGVSSSLKRDTSNQAKELHRRHDLTATVIIEDQDGAAVAAIDLALDRAALPAEVTISAGVITAVHSAASDADTRATADVLVGHPVAGVADGRYRIVSGDEHVAGPVVVQ